MNMMFNLKLVSQDRISDSACFVFDKNSYKLTEPTLKKLDKWVSYFILKDNEGCFIQLNDFSCYEEKVKNGMISFQRFNSILEYYEKKHGIKRHVFSLHDSSANAFEKCYDYNGYIAVRIVCLTKTN